MVKAVELWRGSQISDVAAKLLIYRAFVRKLVEAAEFKFEDAVIPVTVSIGVASLRGEIEDALEFIKQADTHLFAAKEGGRNRVMG